MSRQELDTRLLKAHAERDAQALVRLYTFAGDGCAATGDLDAACFYLTHAFVFALEAGMAEADGLNLRLAEHGRAHRLEF